MSVSSLLAILAIPVWALLIQAVAFRLRRGAGPRTGSMAVAAVVGGNSSDAGTAARHGSGSNQKTAVFCIGVAALGVLAFVGWQEWSELRAFLEAMAFTAICVFCLSHVYFHFFNMSETARRIRILVGLVGHQKSTGSASGDAAGGSSGGEYQPEFLVRVRLQRLLEMGTVQWNPVTGRYTTKWSSLTIAAFAMKWHERLLFPGRE